MSALYISNTWITKLSNEESVGEVFEWPRWAFPRNSHTKAILELLTSPRFTTFECANTRSSIIISQLLRCGCLPRVTHEPETRVTLVYQRKIALIKSSPLRSRSYHLPGSLDLVRYTINNSWNKHDELISRFGCFFFSQNFLRSYLV